MAFHIFRAPVPNWAAPITTVLPFNRAMKSRQNNIPSNVKSLVFSRLLAGEARRNEDTSRTRPAPTSKRSARPAPTSELSAPGALSIRPTLQTRKTPTRYRAVLLRNTLYYSSTSELGVLSYKAVIPCFLVSSWLLVVFADSNSNLLHLPI